MNAKANGNDWSLGSLKPAQAEVKATQQNAGLRR